MGAKQHCAACRGNYGSGLGHAMIYVLLKSPKEVSLLQRQLAVYPYYTNFLADRVDIQESNRSPGSFHRTEHLLLGMNDDHRGFVNPEESFEYFGLYFEELRDRLHFRGRRIEKHQDDVPPIGPFTVFELDDLTQVRHGKIRRSIIFVDDYREVLRFAAEDA